MKQIPNFPGYFATKDGRIWSEKHKKGKFLRPGLHHSGYLQVVLCKNKKHYNHRVHRLVLETFVGPCPPGMECCHNNGIRIDNNLSNLRWDTPSENNKDAVKHGTHTGLICGEECGASKLTEQNVKEIRKLYKSKSFIQRQLADKFNVARQTIGCIIKRISWKHI